MTFPRARVPRRGVKMSSGMVDSETATHMQHDAGGGGDTGREGERVRTSHALPLRTHRPVLLGPCHETFAAVTMILQPSGPEPSF